MIVVVLEIIAGAVLPILAAVAFVCLIDYAFRARDRKVIQRQRRGRK
ncbi:unnamed protein product [marine sediment metagenome]|uniref:Uncharacterized protein n=1 Tax=marine sediment metagenome TaxID=412755 RepID=X1FVW1_9ZZZZ